MKYCAMQTQMMADLSLKRRELREDEQFLSDELLQHKVDNYNLKVNLGKTHNECKRQTEENQGTQEELDQMIASSADYLAAFTASSM
mgnify:CR=1 FL=1